MLLVRPRRNILRGLPLTGIGHDLEKAVQKGIQKKYGPFPGQVRVQFVVGQALIHQSCQIGPGSRSDFTEVGGPAGQVFIPQDVHIHPVHPGMLPDKGQAGGDDGGQPGKEVLVPGLLPDTAQMFGNNRFGLGKDVFEKTLFAAKVLKYRPLGDSQVVHQTVDTGLMVAIGAEFVYGRIQDGLLLFRGYLQERGAWVIFHSVFRENDTGSESKLHDDRLVISCLPCRARLVKLLIGAGHGNSVLRCKVLQVPVIQNTDQIL